MSSPPSAMTTTHHHCAESSAADSSSHLARNPPAGGRPISAIPLSAKAATVIGSARATPRRSATRSCPSAAYIEAGRHEHRGLGGRMRDRLQQAAGQRRRRGGRRDSAQHQRKHQEQVTDLRDGRIRDHQLEARLLERHDAADDDRAGAERGQQLCGGRRHHVGEGVEPQPDDEEERALDHQARQQRARGRRRSSVRGRQPQVQREERRLRQQADRHQRDRDDRHRLGAQAARQQRDVERAVAAVDQHRADQVEHRTGQRVQQVAQRRLQRFSRGRRGSPAARPRKPPVRARRTA